MNKLNTVYIPHKEQGVLRMTTVGDWGANMPTDQADNDNNVRSAVNDQE